jgi:hypothetical protein
MGMNHGLCAYNIIIKATEMRHLRIIEGKIKRGKIEERGLEMKQLKWD